MYFEHIHLTSPTFPTIILSSFPSLLKQHWIIFYIYSSTKSSFCYPINLGYRACTCRVVYLWVIIKEALLSFSPKPTKAISPQPVADRFHVHSTSYAGIVHIALVCADTIVVTSSVPLPCRYWKSFPCCWCSLSLLALQVVIFKCPKHLNRNFSKSYIKMANKHEESFSTITHWSNGNQTMVSHHVFTKMFIMVVDFNS